MSGRRIRQAVVGGGSVWTPELADGIARLGKTLPAEGLVLVDPVVPARIEVVAGLTSCPRRGRQHLPSHRDCGHPSGPATE